MSYLYTVVGIVLILLFARMPANAQSICGLAKLPAPGAFYPSIAKAAHVSGQVVLVASFDHDGKPTVTRVINGPTMLISAARKLVEASSGGPADGSRECPVMVNFNGVPPEWGKNCEWLNSSLHSAKLIDATHVEIVEALGACCCDPAAEITRVKHRLLFLHWYSKA